MERRKSCIPIHQVRKKNALYRGKSIQFFFPFSCEEKVLHQNDRAKWALRKKKIKTIVLSITESCHCTNTPSRTDEFMGIPFSLGRNTGQEVYCLQSAPTPRWKSPRVSFSLRKLSWCILGPQWVVPTSLLSHCRTSSHLINDSEIGFLIPFQIYRFTVWKIPVWIKKWHGKYA